MRSHSEQAGLAKPVLERGRSEEASGLCVLTPKRSLRGLGRPPALAVTRAGASLGRAERMLLPGDAESPCQPLSQALTLFFNEHVVDPLLGARPPARLFTWVTAPASRPSAGSICKLGGLE